jgi:YbgC/YbaW family acyl-CoA thioester hydrolase
MSSGDFVHEERVRFRDLDPMGHVNNAVFLTYLEQARVAFFAEMGAATGLEDMNMIVARVEIDFKAPVRLGQEVEVSVRASRFGTKSFDLDYELRVDGAARRLWPRASRSPTTTTGASRFPCRRMAREAERRSRMSTFERQTLGNGLRVLLAPMPQATSVTCMIMLAAGSRYETRDTNGIAHFSEHMFFKGTERRPTARDIGTEVDGIGGEFNAFTGKEYTGYYVKCAAEFRDTALDVLVDMLRHSKFEEDEIEREKGVIVEEMNMYYDTPRDFIGGVYEELLYGDQPLGWDIIGRKETVRAADRDTFLGYTNRWYHPERMVVGLGGNVGDDAVEKIEQLLGDLAAAETGEPEPADVQANGPRVKIHQKQSDQAHLCLGVPSYPLEHPDRYVLQLLATVLGTGMSSRLFTEVRERRGLAYYVFGINHSYTDAGSLYSQAGVDINRADEAVEVIAASYSGSSTSRSSRRAREVAQPREGPVPASAREPAGDDHVRPAARGARGTGGRPARDSGRLDAVTAEDIQRVAQDVIGGHGLNLA